MLCTVCGWALLTAALTPVTTLTAGAVLPATLARFTRLPLWALVQLLLAFYPLLCALLSALVCALFVVTLIRTAFASFAIASVRAAAV